MPRHTKIPPVKPPEVGLLLMDASLKPIYANAQAVQILAYPEHSRNMRSVGSFLSNKIRSMVPNGDFSTRSYFPTELVSGSRRYLCRTFQVNSHRGNSSRPTVAMLLERVSCGSVDLSKVCQQYSLTPRERQAVEFLIQGLTGKEIASRMRISPNTVKAFIRLVMIKMGVSTRSGIMGRIIGTQPLLDRPGVASPSLRD